MRIWLPFLILVSGCSAQAPTDAEMESTFRSHEVAFAQLRAKLCQQSENRVIMMEPAWSRPVTTEAEREAFYALFKKLGARGVYYDGNCSFRLMVWGTGFAGGGSSRGYSYRPSAERLGVKVNAPLDGIASNGQRVFLSRPLGNDWYIHFYHWP